MNATSTNKDDLLAISELVTKVQSGDKQAFTHLVASVNNTVNAIALAITKDLQDSNDVSQLVFIKLWQQIDELKNSESLFPWLRQITRYTALNFIRDNKRQKSQSVDEQQIEILLQHLSESPENHDDKLIKTQQNQVIAYLMEQLPQESREIVILYYREEKNSQHVARLLGLTEASVRKRLQRVREQLKDKMLNRYGKVIFATSPIGFATILATTAMSSSPVAASTLAYTAAAKQSHWFSKLLYGLGGAAIGGILAVIANTFAMNQIIKHIDNEQDIAKLKKIKQRSTILIIITCSLFSLSYVISDGWLLPVLTYFMFLAGLMVHINAANAISFANLSRQALTSESAKLKLKRDKFFYKVGCIFGLGGGSIGLLYGLYNSGRMLQLL